MKKTILLFAIIFSLFSCSKDDEPTPDATSSNYRLNKVTYQNGNYDKYTYNSQGKLAVMEEFSASNVSLDKTTYAYNSQGKLITMHRVYTDNFTNTSDTQYTYNGNGFLEVEISNSVYHNNTSASKSTYTFNNNGQLIRRQTVYKDNNTGMWGALSPSVDYTYTINAQGKIQRIENANHTRKFDYGYDNNGNLKDIMDYEDMTGNAYVLQNWRSFTFDDKINPENDVFGFIYNLKNKNNTLDAVIKYYTNGVLSNTQNFTNTYEYNAQGYPTKVNGNVYAYETY